MTRGVISQKFKKFRLSHPQEDFQRRSSGYFTSHQAENSLVGDRRHGLKQKQSFRNEDIHQLALKAQKLVEDIRSSGAQKETGLLTDSLSCIFTRRPKKNNQHKTPQKRVFFEEVREEDTRPKNTEPVQRPQYPKKDGSSCPRPPTISQKYVDNNWSHLSMEEEAQESNCPEPPVLSTRDKSQITHDASLEESNVSPYVPKNKFDVDEYTKYKTEQLEKESKYKHGDTSPRYQQVEEPDNDDPLNGEDYDELSKYDIASYAISSGNTRFGKNAKEKDYYDEPVNYERESYYKDFAEYRNKRQSSEYEEREVEDICPQPPHISPQPSEIEQEPDHSDLAPEAPAISDVQRSYYEKPSFVPPKQPCETQKKCPRCSFQTPNLKRLKDHLKFVHGETAAHGVEEQPPKKAANELFSRREPKVVESELFSRRQYARRDEVPVEDAGAKKKQFPGGFKRRNTAVNVISTEVLIPARKDTVESERLETAEDDYDDEASELRKEAGVLAAMEYFETSKDQPKKPRPYKRNADELLDDDWF